MSNTKSRRLLYAENTDRMAVRYVMLYIYIYMDKLGKQAGPVLKAKRRGTARRVLANWYKKNIRACTGGSIQILKCQDLQQCKTC